MPRSETLSAPEKPVLLPSGPHRHAWNCNCDNERVLLSRSMYEETIAAMLPWQQEQMLRGLLLCDEMWTVDLMKKRNGGNGYGFMSVWTAATLLLRQLGVPYASPCIFDDVSLRSGWIPCFYRRIAWLRPYTLELWSLKLIFVMSVKSSFWLQQVPTHSEPLEATFAECIF